MSKVRNLKLLSVIFSVMLVVLLSACGSGSVKVKDMTLISSELNGFEIEVSIEKENTEVYTSLINENGETIKGYEFDLDNGSNVVSFRNLQNNGNYTVNITHENEVVKSLNVTVGSVIFTGISSQGEINTGLLIEEGKTSEINEPIGLTRTNTNGEYIVLNFDNPNELEIKEVMFGGEIISKDQFGPGSTSTEVHVKVLPNEQPVSEVHRFNNYTITVDGTDKTIYPDNYNIVTIATVKLLPELKEISTVLDIANRKGEAAIAVYLDDNDEEVEIVAITVNGVRYDEADEEFTNEDQAMFKVNIEGSSGTENLIVESIEYDDLGGINTFDLKSLTTSFTVSIQDLGKGTRTSPIKIDSVEDLLRMGKTPVWSSKNTVYKLTKDIDFDDVDSYEDPANFEIYSRLGSVATGWQPYGWTLETSEYHDFNAILDGDNHKIKNLYIYKPGLFDAAFFASIGEYGEVKNLYFEDAYVTGTYASVVTSFLLGTIDKVAIINSNDPDKELNTSIIHLVSNQDDSDVHGSAIAGYLTSRYVVQDRCEDDPFRSVRRLGRCAEISGRSSSGC